MKVVFPEIVVLGKKAKAEKEVKETRNKHGKYPVIHKGVEMSFMKWCRMVGQCGNWRIQQVKQGRFTPQEFVDGFTESK
jgi:hypothetical protein